MFDAVRNNKKIVQVFLALITLPFAFWGVDSYVRGAGTGNDYASVGDSKITPQQFQEAWRNQMDRARQQLGANFKQEQFDTPETRMAVVNSLVDQRLLLLEAHKGRLGASNALLVDIISSMPSLQEDGKFSRARYEAALRAQGMSPDQFEAQLRQDLTMQQLVGAVADTGIVSVNHSMDSTGGALAGNTVLGLAIRGLDVWAATSYGQDDNGDRVGGGMSRWDGQTWRAWRSGDGGLRPNFCRMAHCH